VLFHKLKKVEEALEEALKYVREMDVEEVPLSEAYGRILAVDVYSPIDVPPFDRAAVDGYAVRAEDTYGAFDATPKRLRVVGRITPGSSEVVEISEGEAVEISTGAPIPRGANAVVMVEYTREVGGEVEVYRSVSPGENVVWAGSDIMSGELILRRCTTLGPREVGLLASIGVPRVPVFRRPQVAVISVGDELVPPGLKLKFGEVYDVNSYSLSAALAELGAVPKPLGIARDREEDLVAILSKAVEDYDMVLISGGTSAGVGDLTYRAIDRLGPPGVIVHGLAIRPGKPTVVGVSRSGKLIIGLPGYPANALIVFDLLVKPILSKMLCIKREDPSVIKARIPIRVHGAKGRRTFQLVSLVESSGGITAYPLRMEGGPISSLALADGYFVIPEDVEYVEEGEEVEVRLFSTFYKPAELYLIGSHDVLLDHVVQSIGLRAKAINVGSMGGVQAVKRKEADVAGVHLLDEETGEYNRTLMSKLGVSDAVLVRGYAREQGLIVARGNPKGIGGIEDLLRRDVVMVNRQRGSGTRTFLDLKLREVAERLGVPAEELTRRIRGYTTEARTHTAVASAVAQGRADVGVGIRMAASMYGLDFISLGWEIYDFLIPKERLLKKSVRRFVEFLKTDEFRRIVGRFEGYAVLPETGEVIAEY